MNRKMFNRGARKELRKKGGIEDVQHFKNAGPVVGQVGSGIPGVELGRTFIAPYSSTTSSKLMYPIASTMGKAAEKGLGSLGPIEQGILQSAAISSLGDEIISGDSFTGTPLESIARGILGYPVKLGAAIPGIPLGVAQAFFTGEPGLTPDESKPKFDKDGNRIDTDIKLGNLGQVLGSMVPDRELMESYGFQFFPTSGEELERFKRMQKIKQDNEKRDAAVEKQKQNLKSSDAINAALAASAQSEGKSTLGESDKAFIDSLKGTTVEVNPTTGNVKVTEDPSKPDSISQQKIQEAVAEGPGSELDFDLGKDGEEILNEIVNKNQIETETETKTKTKKDDQYTLDRGAKDPIDSTSTNEVKQVFETGNEEQKKNVIDDIIKQFTDRAPKYEGLNQGLAIAKIGFAMAAGESPNAMTNIAKALNDGADMLIKDKQKKDEFNRQIALTGLQLGLTEQFKINQEERLAKTKRNELRDKPFVMIAGEDLEYNGKKYSKDSAVPISQGDLMDGNLPDNLLPVTFAAQVMAGVNDSIKEYNKNIAAVVKAKQMSAGDAATYTENYQKEVNRVIQAQNGIGLLSKAMLITAEDGTTGLSNSVKTLIDKGSNFFGLEVGKQYRSKQEAISAMKQALQDLIPVTLGGVQSANSISNRDVEFLISAYFGEGALSDSPFTLQFQSKEIIIDKLQGAMEKMENAQRTSIGQMRSMESILMNLYKPGTTESALGIIEPLKEPILPYFGQTFDTAKIFDDMYEQGDTNQFWFPVFKLKT